MTHGQKNIKLPQYCFVVSGENKTSNPTHYSALLFSLQSQPHMFSSTPCSTCNLCFSLRVTDPVTAKQRLKQRLHNIFCVPHYEIWNKNS